LSILNIYKIKIQDLDKINEYISKTKIEVCVILK